MTPAAKPSIESMSLGFTVFVKKTRPAPATVTPHVKSVAISACMIWTVLLNEVDPLIPTPPALNEILYRQTSPQ